MATAKKKVTKTKTVAKKAVKKTTKPTAKKVTTATPTKRKQNTIFVQIAAYRDPELLNTLRDCIAKAKNPKNLRFGIAWQHSPHEEWDNLDEYKNDKRFKIIDIDYRDARGPCWARHQINQLFSGETYTLQLDSHHRFTEHWDQTLIDMLEGLRNKKCPKPLLSSYLPSFDPNNDPAGRIGNPWIMEFDRFAPEGPVHFLPHTIDEWRELDKPVPTRFMSGHFIFADGIFCREVEYNPNYYFHGEEIDLSARSYMAGYDLFAPHKAVMWHEYTRQGKKKHWDDNNIWLELDKNSHEQHRELYGIDGIDTDKKLKKHVRTLRDYEIYAGIEFSTRRAHKRTIEKVRPPVSTTAEEHDSGLLYYHKMCIDIYKGSLPERDYNVVVVALEDENGKEFFRQDAHEDEIKRLLEVPMETDKFIHIWRTLYSEQKPARWVVWPHSLSKGWQERMTGKFGRSY